MYVCMYVCKIFGSQTGLRENLMIIAVIMIRKVIELIIMMIIGTADVS